MYRELFVVIRIQFYQKPAYYFTIDDQWLTLHLKNDLNKNKNWKFQQL